MDKQQKNAAVDRGGQVNFSNPQFIGSIGDGKVPAELRYVVFAGRSNAGKSSIINTLCNGRFARVAKTPGRTRLINLFRLGGDDFPIALADLPGYGYAAVSAKEQRRWAPRLTRFLQVADICCLAVVIDCRRGIGELDMQLFDLYAPRRRAALVILNKADKLTRSQRQTALAEASRLTTHPVILFSVSKKIGVQAVRDYIGNCL